MKKSKMMLGVLFIICLVLSFGSPVYAKDVIKIGVIGPMQFLQGKGHWNGSLMARDEVNAAGGVKVGKKTYMIELVKEDSNEFINMTDATNAMERMCTRHKVDYLVGGFRTEAVMAMQDIAMDYKKIFIGCGAAHPELCNRVAKDYDRYKYFFRGTPFNSSYLAKTSFIHLATVAGILKAKLGIEKIKVAIVGEKLSWVDPMVAASQKVIPSMGMEIAGIWRPSDKATDVTSELSAIQSSGAHIIFTIFSASVGITFARQAGELKVPIAQAGINVEAQKTGFYEATQGYGNYVMTMNTYAEGVYQTELTKHFLDEYVKRYGEFPTYTADTYAAIKYGLVPAIEKAGTLDPDKVVAVLENMVYKVPSGTVKYTKDENGTPNHDLKWGPGYLTSLGVQWQDGEMKAVWPYKWKPKEGVEISYDGVVPYKIAPWILDKYKK